MNVIFGASGHAREVEFLLRTASGEEKAVAFFIANDMTSTSVKTVSVISEVDFKDELKKHVGIIRAYIAIGDSSVREIVAEKFSGYDNIQYPNFVSFPAIGDASNVRYGVGNIFFPSVMLTTDIIVGDHNHFNLNASVSHDCIIGNYNTISPGVRIAGGVKIGSHNFFGVGACVIDKVSIGNNVIVGAGATVTENLMVAGTYVGVPARRIK